MHAIDSLTDLFSQDYIKEKRTIIMAVVSAKNDYANQIILKKCRDVDPKGHRTLGIITKPDYLTAGGDNESNWLDLALNKVGHHSSRIFTQLLFWSLTSSIGHLPRSRLAHAEESSRHRDQRQL